MAIPVETIEWLKKMGDVLGKFGGPKNVAPQSPAKTPGNAPVDAPAGSNGTPSGNGGPSPESGGTSGGGQPPTAGTADPKGDGTGKCVDAPGGKKPAGGGGGGKPAGGGGGGKPKGGASGGGKPADGGSGGAKPAEAPIPPALAGKSAKECAEFAKNALAKLEGLEAQSKTIASASANFVTDAQAGKKAAEEAQKQSDEAEKAMPPVPTIAAPTGSDDKQKYESAMKISADVNKVAADAYIQAEAIKTQKGAAKDGQEKADRIHEAVKQNSETLKTYAEQATGHASGAAGAIRCAENAASEAKQKADKAAKDKSADKDDLKKKADEEEGYAKAARDAAGRAQTIAQSIGEMSKKMEADAATVTAAKTETTTIADAVAAKGDGTDTKIKPYEEAAQKAEDQEAEAKGKLSDEDAEAILQKRYDELGGDPALKRVLDEADKAYTNETESMRAEIKDWKNDQLRELDKMTTTNSQDLEQYKKAQKDLKEFVDREDPLAKKIKDRVEKLGDKKDTERGKEVSGLYAELESQVSEAQAVFDAYKVVVEKTEAVKEAIEGRYGPIKEKHDASERFLKERQTEFDNTLEMDTMELEQKVSTLDSSPELQIKKFVALLKTEKERIVAETVEDLKLQAMAFEPPREARDLKPIDWSALEKALTYVESKSVDDLKADDAGLTKVQEEYDKAGGDAALFKKLHDDWQQKQLKVEQQMQAANKRFEGNSEKLRGRLNEAASDESTQRESVEQLKSQYDSAKQELDDFMNNASDLTKQQLAREKYLKREVPQLEKQYEAAKSRLSTVTTNKESIEKLMKSQQEQNDAVQDDDAGQDLYEPVMSEVAAVPLRTKFVKLTGNQPPA